jgi:hypothetical protein
MNSKVISALCLTGMLTACSDGRDSNNGPSYTVDPTTIDVSQAGYCDITQPALCLFPFPSDFFTQADNATPTGKRVNFDSLAMPINQSGEIIDPGEYNRNDGFSIGATLLSYVEGLDLNATGASTITDMGVSLNADTPIQLINAATGERQLIWAEIDQVAQGEEPQALMIRIGKVLENGQRYIVVMQNLRDADGELIEPDDAFKVYQEAAPSDIPELESRRDHFESLFSTLNDYGIDRDTLYLTWDFTTVSTENTTVRALHMRDTSLSNLSGTAPAITISSVVNTTPVENADIAREIEGTITVPNFMDNLHSSTATQPLKYPSYASSHKRLSLMRRTVTPIPKLWLSVTGFLATATSPEAWALEPS